MPIKSESVNSNFNTDDFPTNLEDIDWGLIEMEDAASPVLPSQQPPETQELMVPVTEVTEVPLEAAEVPQCQSPTTTNSDKDDDESEDDDDNNNSRLTLPPRKSGNLDPTHTDPRLRGELQEQVRRSRSG